MQKSQRIFLPGLLFAFSLIAPSAAYAQSLEEAMRNCADISDGADRLACYDGLAGALNRNEIAAAPNVGQSAEQSVAAAPASPPAPVLTAEEAFGREDLPKVQKEERDKKLKMITAKVVEIARNKRGKYVVILDNGQIWRQIQADTNKLLVPKNSTGLTVEIKRKMLGAHDLVLETGRRAIRVERIK